MAFDFSDKTEHGCRCGLRFCDHYRKAADRALLTAGRSLLAIIDAGGSDLTVIDLAIIDVARDILGAEG